MTKSKSKGKNKSDKDAGQRTPGGVATRDPEASHDGASPKESRQNYESPLQACLSGKMQRVSSTDSFGACPCHRPWIAPQGATPAE